MAGCLSLYSRPGQDTDGDFVTAGRVASQFTVFQIDPPEESSAGPQVVASGDLDGDGLDDLVTGWNQSQPVQAHFQRRNEDGDISFETLPLGGTTPIAVVAALRVADVDDDGRNDVVVLVKDTGLVALCDTRRADCDPSENGGVVDGAVDGGIVVFFAPEDPVGMPWEPIELRQTFFAGLPAGELPEEGGYTDIQLGLIDADLYLDFVVAFNSAEGEPPYHRIDFIRNPGLAAARQSSGWAPVTLFEDLPNAGSIVLADVDGDIDVDVVCTYPNSASANVRWLPNPLVELGPDAVAGPWLPIAPIGQVDTHADVIRAGDVDGDGITDIVVKSTEGGVIQWFKGPVLPSLDFVRAPWQVYTIAEFKSAVPESLALGDINGDGLLDAVVSAGGAIVWFDSSGPDSVYLRWTERLIVDDSADGDQTTVTTTVSNDNAGANDNTSDNSAVTIPSVTVESNGTLMAGLIVLDIDGDGMDDFVATVDRKGVSGLTDDAVVWFRNEREEP